MKWPMKNDWVNSSFGAGLLSHVNRFMLKMKLYPIDSKGFIAVSAGADSMALLYVLSKLFKKQKISLEVLHVNHGTRPENTKEENLVKEFCLKHGHRLHIKKLQLDPKASNFESIARERRKEFFLQHTQKGDIVYTAHHIDDSFEWSLMQKFKTSSKTSSLGIPVWNRPFARPFMSVTKSQILTFIKKESLSFLEDSSNQDDHYERNYLRAHIIPHIAKKYPNYLKHYVHRSNELACEWRVSRARVQVGSHFKEYDEYGGIFLINSEFENNFLGKEQLILECIKSLSIKKRGILKSQIQKLIEASLRGQKGPLSFSGGVQGYILQGCLYFASKKTLKNWHNLEEELLNKISMNSLELVNYEEISQLKITKNPIIFYLDKNIKLKPMKRPHPLLKKATYLALKKGLSFHELSRFKLLVRNSRERNEV